VERLLARLERRFGRRAPGNLTYALIAAQVVGLVLGLTSPETLGLLHFDIDRILAGEVWRLLSWLAIPPSQSPFWALFALYWLYIIGTSLEGEWGAFKFLVYWLVGVIGTIVAAALAHAPAGNSVFLMTLFLAFATLWPDYEIRVFFVLPIKVKWLAFLDVAFLLQYTFTRPGLEKLLPLMGVANYLLFFGDTLWDRLRGLAGGGSRTGARDRMRAAAAESGMRAVRQCAICGVSSEDPAVDMRVCNCAKCGGVLRDLCLPHARNH
jgi:membrane associated rhomboid family serine protease/ribosomal protein L37AE/L43A